MGNELLAVLTDGSLGIEEIRRRLKATVDIDATTEDIAIHLELMRAVGLVKRIQFRGVSNWSKVEQEN